MSHLIVEIKARTTEPHQARRILEEHGAEHRGRDHQIDTYFKCSHGRLKLRQGNIETHLIHYERSDQLGPKESRVTLYASSDAGQLRDTLRGALGVLVVVDKERDIYFAGNVKLHVDEVAGLGSFVEVEAIDVDGSRSAAELQSQCEHFMALLGVRESDLLSHSYSDMLLSQRYSDMFLNQR